MLAGLAGGLLAAAAHAETPSRGGTLTVGLSNDSKTYDPIFSVQYSERYVLYLAFDTLVKYGPDFSIQPELAESWETSAGRQAHRVQVARGRDIPGRHAVRRQRGEVEHRPAAG